MFFLTIFDCTPTLKTYNLELFIIIVKYYSCRHRSTTALLQLKDVQAIGEDVGVMVEEVYV